MYMCIGLEELWNYAFHFSKCSPTRIFICTSVHAYFVSRLHVCTCNDWEICALKKDEKHTVKSVYKESFYKE